MIIDAQVTSRILDAATEVHSALGPGLLENTYAKCLARELREAGIKVDTEVAINIEYKGLVLDSAYRLDLVVADAVVVEIKSVDRLLPVHGSQVLTYLRFSGLRFGLLLNFNVHRLKLGIRRFVRDRHGSPVAPVDTPCSPCPP